MADWRKVLTIEGFKRLSQKYSGDTGFCVTLVCGKRIILNECGYYPWEEAEERRVDFQQMIQESMRWGEPNIALDSHGIYLWCAPICLNNRAAGGLFSAAHETLGTIEQAERITRAAWKLLELACKRNLCNTSLMHLSRQQSRSSADKHHAIETVKRSLYQNPREIYLQEEFGLLAAIRKGEKARARQIINNILIRIYSLGQHDVELLKTLVLEMVVLMYRTAVDRGADPKELMGINSSYLRTYHRIENEIDLSNWLTSWLEEFISTSLHNVEPSPPESIALALEFMKNNLDEPLTRDQVAQACNMSPGYFSKIFKEKTGQNFTNLLNQFRIEQACTLLDESAYSIYEIAFRTGFNDQSYFCKVFKKYRHMNPKDYRRTLVDTAAAS